MRVTEQMIFSTIAAQLQRKTAALLKIQEQVATGKAINRPSDDPIGYTQILNFETTLAMTAQYLRNISQADTYLLTSESALQSVQDQLARAHELAVQMANATYTAADRANAASEVRQIYDQLISVANTSIGGRYIFAGDQISTRPFVSQGQSIGTPITLPVTIVAGTNDALTIEVDGVSSTLTLPAGIYATGSDVASMVQTAVNSDPTFQTAGLSVTIQYDTDHLVITSDSVGGISSVVLTGGNSLTSLGLNSGYIGTPITFPVDLSSDTLDITVDGISSTVTLTDGTFTTGAALATQLQTDINSDPTFVGAGITVTIQFDTDHVVITTNSSGPTSSVLPTAGTGTVLADLGLASGISNSQPAGSYHGDSEEIPVLIGDGAEMITNLPGDRLFQGIGLSGGVDVFASVAAFQVALETNDTAAIQTALTDLSAAQEQMSGERTLLGARLNRTEATAATLEDFKLTMTKLKSERGDVDMTRAISELIFQQFALEVTQASAARLFEASLLNFLR